jgi:hypothetical protein
MRSPVAALAVVAVLGILPIHGPEASWAPAAVSASPALIRIDRANGYHAIVSRIPLAIRERMTGSSWHPGCPVPLSDLRLIRLTYRGFDGARHLGKLVVHRRFAVDVARAFAKVYAKRFPIRRMLLVDRYGADDKESMKHDNTSAFNCRYRNGVCCTWSMHAYGKAIDVNPVENPEIWSGGVSPPNGQPFVDRSVHRPGMIFHGDRVWWAFRAIGWPWGGDWSPPDYQHFSSNGR